MAFRYLADHDNHQGSLITEESLRRRLIMLKWNEYISNNNSHLDSESILSLINGIQAVSNHKCNDESKQKKNNIE
jgi:hypothetical protein